MTTTTTAEANRAVDEAAAVDTPLTVSVIDELVMQWQDSGRIVLAPHMDLEDEDQFAASDAATTHEAIAADRQYAILESETGEYYWFFDSPDRLIPHHLDESSVEITESGEYCVWVSPDGQCTIDMGDMSREEALTQLLGECADDDEQAIIRAGTLETVQCRG